MFPLLLVTLFIMFPYPPFTTKHNANFSMAPSMTTHFLSLAMLILSHFLQMNISNLSLVSLFCCLLGYEPKKPIVTKTSYSNIFASPIIWNFGIQPVYCLWSFNQSSSNLLYSLILLSPSIASPQKNLGGMPAQGILLFRSFSMYLMCLILILLIYTILSLPKLLIFVALVE